jgi:hypothetical protein
LGRGWRRTERRGVSDPESYDDPSMLKWDFSDIAEVLDLREPAD